MLFLFLLRINSKDWKDLALLFLNVLLSYGEPSSILIAGGLHLGLVESILGVKSLLGYFSVVYIEGIAL